MLTLISPVIVRGLALATRTPTPTIAMTASGTRNEEATPIVTRSHPTELPSAASGSRWGRSFHSPIAKVDSVVNGKSLPGPQREIPRDKTEEIFAWRSTCTSLQQEFLTRVSLRHAQDFGTHIPYPRRFVHRIAAPTSATSARKKHLTNRTNQVAQ